MSRPEGASLTTWRAVALGLLQGPAELLPISSSGHLVLLPWLLSWDYEQLDGEMRKAFEVALHAGTSAAMLITLREEVRRTPARLFALSAAPAALAGYLFERPIGRRLGTPVTVACGLLGGAVLIAYADRRPQRRRFSDADGLDALWLGLAQAIALVPGVSRGGATLAAARLRGFCREDAHRLSRQVGLPVVGGAALLKGVRVRRGGAGPPFLAGSAASFGSTLAAARLIPHLARDRSLLPYAAYRTALAIAVLRVARSRSAPSTKMAP
jgi:undecaprenyl-diphosphatase